MKIIFIIIGLMIFVTSSGQNQGNIWYFGIHAGLDFNSGSPVVLENGVLDSFEGTSSMCTPSGELLFYTDGITVYDATHNVMMNGCCLRGSWHTTQSALIVPVPGSTSHYLIFTLDYAYSSGIFAYSEVDMTQNNGLGAVISKNVPIQYNCTEKISAVYHENLRDIWIIVHKRANSVFQSFLLTSSGLSNTPVVSAAGPAITGMQGYLKASRDGSMLAMATYHQRRAEIYNFDKSTGIVSYHSGLLFPDATYGVEFSADKTMLYVGVSYDLKQIYQVNLANNTSTLIATTGMAPGAMQLGPDGKIYVSRYERPDISSSYLGVINSPELQGTACNYVDQAVFLGNGLSQMGLPTSLYFPPCTASANFSSDSACSHQAFHFTDLSSTANGYIQKWIWNFGDGTPEVTINFPDSPNVEHVFPVAGTYNVALTVITTEGCNNITVHAVNVMPGPTARFNFAGNCVSQSIQFTDASLLNGAGNINSWIWNFGDATSGVNNTSILTNPVHVFSIADTFDVTLIVTNLAGCTDTIIRQVISDHSTPLDYIYTGACIEEVFSFSPDAVVMNPEMIASWLWDFGDGTTSTNSNPQHVYTQAGIYPVTLSVTDTLNCSNSLTHPITVAAPPSVYFTYMEPTCFNSPILFNDLTFNNYGQMVSWQWDFEDGQTSALQNPIHVYGASASYLVCLTVQNECGQGEYCTIITVPHEPISNFTHTYLGELEVEFTNQSTFADSLAWDFGDGQGSTELNPVHTYTVAGDYQVCLLAKNECHTVSNCRTIPVQINSGRRDYLSDAGITIFPNPAKDELFVNTDGLKIYQIDMYTSQGANTDRIISENPQNSFRISLIGKSSGNYFLRFYTNKGWVTRSFIVQ
jgi:PKD repeat protein